MQVEASIERPPTLGERWEDRWEGPDRGIIAAWLRGIEKAREDPVLAQKAIAGELPVLPWKGGLARSIKTKKKIGSLLYLAMWTGLRGESISVNTDIDESRTCTAHGVTVTFTLDIQRLFAAGKEDSNG